MNKLIQDLLQGKGENYILPFFWQHGEDEKTLREYMKVINDCGIGAVCVESRPHPDFVGDKWWEDMDVIIDEAKNRNMKVWILDDAHFPTGIAAGKMVDADPEICKMYIDVNKTDICGPVPEATLDISALAKTNNNPFSANSFFGMGDKTRVFDTDKLLAVIASKLVKDNDVDDTMLDLTDKVENGTLEWDVPEGMWRIFVLFQTQNGGGRTDYINMLDKASCRVQIDAVYEPHYKHYKEEFGKTIAGFFSDEPAVGNTSGFNFDESIGRKKMPLPWSAAMPKMMEDRLGKDYIKSLIALWTNVGDSANTGKVRYAYMDAATRLISENFADQIGAWCERHGVEYIGHVIEDNNQHSRLGPSQGHFFRSMSGQHMSGIDDIGNQVLLGGENHRRISPFADGGDGEFYHFELGKLGSSLAHVDPKKHGRAMCEIYGAYGWHVGVRLMKYITDHFLVRGINYFVPHAFTAKDFPDPDCPPHFYAHGENPQYKHFGNLMRYTNRMCNLFNNGIHVAPVAMLYHGEAEWTGEYMFNQKPSRQLLENQIDFDIVPSDLFADKNVFSVTEHNTLEINGEHYKTLVVPYAEFITKDVAKFVIDASKRGFRVVFINALPKQICEVLDKSEEDRLLNAISGCKVVELETLAAYLKCELIGDVVLEKPFKGMRYYHYINNNVDMYMFSNEHASESYDGYVTVNKGGKVSFYDAMENAVYKADYESLSNGTKMHLNLQPYQSIVAIFDDLSQCEKESVRQGTEIVTLSKGWKVSAAESLEYPNFKEIARMDTLHSVGKILPNFSGYICYEKEFNYDKVVSGKEILAIENAYEGVEVWINGQNMGMKMCPPYNFNAAGSLKSGANSIRIEVATTLYRKVKTIDNAPNFFSASVIVLEPTGIVGKVDIIEGV